MLDAQAAFKGEPWYDTVSESYDEPRVLRFIARLFDFEPAGILRKVTCPTLALFGAADTQVDAQSSMVAFATQLPPSAHNGFAVFPGADHGLFRGDRDRLVPRREQLAPAYGATVAAFLADRRHPAAQRHP